MRQLSGTDATFLYTETASAPMHVSALTIYDQSTAEGGKVRFTELVKNYTERLRDIPAMTSRLVTVPLDLDHPYWVSDGTFDPEFHIRHLALPAPGDWRQLCILISRLHARPLDRDRPLWEAYIIEGLDNVEGMPKGCFAVFTKTHHAAIDGSSSIDLAAAFHDLTPDYKADRKSVEFDIERQPSNWELVTRAQWNNIKKPFHFLGVARNTMPGLAKVLNGLRKGELQRVKNVPRTRFNQKVSPHRVFQAVEVELQIIKDIKNAFPGATVNDVALTIVGGALRKYLNHHKELPEDSLVSMAPINVRTSDDKAGGNIISSMAVKLRTDIEDPLGRLAAVNEGTRDAKELASAIGARTMTDYSEFIPSVLAARASKLVGAVQTTMKPAFNCVVTNVPGPTVPLYSTGAKMLAYYGAGPVLDGLGLIHVITSYHGKFFIAVTSCREMMPDPGFYRDCVTETIDELVAAAASAAANDTAKSTRKKRAKS